ncbi:ESX secretion-associated protein EspG [Mycobacterium sp.]|uniref:ESX secretion-associated protein EspG n=1 Tax=Mycobacterium sp. TaxID=1785 RepID=UPI003C780EF5
MDAEPNAVELTVDNAWFIAETIGAGSFPWVLAITSPYSDAAQRQAFFDTQKAELTRMGLLEPDGSKTGRVNPAVADWIAVVCFPDRWLDLRYIGVVSATGTGEMLRGVVARRAASTGKTASTRSNTGRTPNTIVALRNAQLITFTAMDIDDPLALVPVLGVGLAHRPPARFDEFSMPMRVGARADERLRAGTPLAEVFDYLGIPGSARSVVESVFAGPSSYVEIVAGCRRDGQHATTEVGLSLVDTAAGRLLISPSRAFDGEWVSTFTPATPFATAVAIKQLTAVLPDGPWFPGHRLSRDFSAQPF